MVHVVEIALLCLVCLAFLYTHDFRDATSFERAGSQSCANGSGCVHVDTLNVGSEVTTFPQTLS